MSMMRSIVFESASSSASIFISPWKMIDGARVLMSLRSDFAFAGAPPELGLTATGAAAPGLGGGARSGTASTEREAAMGGGAAPPQAAVRSSARTEGKTSFSVMRRKKRPARAGLTAQRGGTEGGGIEA